MQLPKLSSICRSTLPRRTAIWLLEDQHGLRCPVLPPRAPSEALQPSEQTGTPYIAQIMGAPSVETSDATLPPKPLLAGSLLPSERCNMKASCIMLQHAPSSCPLHQLGLPCSSWRVGLALSRS